MKLTNSEALFLLGFDTADLRARDPETIKAAFNQRVKETHPDALKLGGTCDMDQLKQARELLLNRRNVSEFACKQCKGKGNVPARMGVKSCAACKGTGETQ